MQKSIFSLLEKIRAIGLEGQYYTKDPYDKERYEQLLKIGAEEQSTVLNLPPSDIIEIYKKDFGCITPKVGVDILVANNDNKIFILKRSGSGKWCLPGGWIDFGESPFETVKRELKEEAGISIEPLKFITVTHKGPDAYEGFPYQVNILVDTARVSTKTKVTLNHEHIDFKWISREDIVDWHGGHERYFPMLFDYLKTNRSDFVL